MISTENLPSVGDDSSKTKHRWILVPIFYSFLPEPLYTTERIRILCHFGEEYFYSEWLLPCTFIQQLIFKLLKVINDAMSFNCKAK